MSTTTTPPPEVLVTRGPALDELKATLAEVRRDEQSRKWWQAAAAIVPWFIALVAAGFAVSFALLVWHRPVPKDHFMIAVMHADGSYEPPIERNDLPVSKRANLLDYTTIRFVTAWEGYVWRANQANYNFISAVTAGQDLRKQYQGRFAEGVPGNLDDKYGPDVTRDVPAIQIVRVPNAPDALDAMMLVRLHKPGETTCQRWRARFTFKDDEKGLLPLEIQKLYDPLDIIFVSYESSVDPAAPQIVACS